MVAERQANWLMWKAALLSFGVAEAISEDGNRASAPFARLGFWFEQTRVRWFPKEFHRPADGR